MNVQKINQSIVDAQSVPTVLDQAGITFNAINTVNWDNFPYHPKVAFRIAHTNDAILIHYRVAEKSIRARYGEDGGNVWTDSCVEFFSIPDYDCNYYNLECNCAGTLLLAVGPDRHNRQMAPPEVMASIKRWSSLGREPFEEKEGECTWELALIVPYTAFFKHHVPSMDGRLIRANFYKCGDELQTPHFLSWNPIRTENPDFHCPEFFGELYFE